jgi:hypothetical protein
MSLIDALNRLFAITPIKVRELDRNATLVEPTSTRRESARPPEEEFEVTDEYVTVHKLIDAGIPIIFVSGKAGTGKTTLIRYLRRECKKNIAVVAFMGVAALNAGGMTIHKFFSFPARILFDRDIVRKSDRRLYKKLDLLIIDEVSMVRADLLDAIDAFLRKNGRDRNKPFGGTQLLLVGDLFQLPPVVDDGAKKILRARGYTSRFFFSAKSLRSCDLVAVELSKNYRQRDANFADMLNQIRVAENLDEVIPRLNARCIASKGDDSSVLTLTCKNDPASDINEARLRELPGETRTYQGQITGSFTKDLDKLPAPLELSLKIGAQVMFVKNDRQNRWVNGTLGRVVGLDENSIRVEAMAGNPGETFEVEKVDWESFEFEFDQELDEIVPVVSGRFTQFPLMLAWAVTIHKCQGKTLDSVRVDLGTGGFASGQVYVALSRCRSLQDLSLATPIRPADVICDRRISRFYSRLPFVHKKADPDSKAD